MKRSFEKSEKDLSDSKQEIINKFSTNLDPIQAGIIDFCFKNPNKNLFITGQGGSGKSFIIDTICQIAVHLMKTLVVTASTGCAAVNIRGITLHTFVGIGLGEEKRDYAISLRPDVKRRIQSTEMLIIDETSMISPKYITKANEVIQKVRQSKDFFGGIQVILVGDFFQLPPVSKESQGTNAKKYIFQDDIWKLINPSCHVLRTNYRQKNDESYSAFLSKMRCGKLTNEEFSKICQTIKSNKIPEGEDIPRLFPKRENAEHFNSSKLASIEGQEYVYEFHGNNFEKLEKCVNVNKTLILKVGVGVLLCKNLDVVVGLCNGTYGKVVSFQQALSDSKPYPMVKFEGISNPIKITEQKWEMMNESGKIIADLYQLPLMLSYGITIHKSQGMTLSRVVINPGFFENGQAYVAFSRVRSLSGVFMEPDKNIPFSSVKTDRIVVKFYEDNGLI